MKAKKIALLCYSFNFTYALRGYALKPATTRHAVEKKSSCSQDRVLGDARYHPDHDYSPLLSLSGEGNSWLFEP
eukprot:scaffold286830_cov22-Tisochrysis_lutea.AAC.1